MSLIIFVFIGFLTGFLSGLLGVGGGFILVPLLIIIGVPANLAVGSSLGYIVFTALSGAVQHRRQGNCDLRLASVLLLGGVLTVHFGAIALRYLEAGVLRVLLSLLLAGTAIKLITATSSGGSEKGALPNSKPERSYGANLALALAIGATLGFLSGLLGVGGGFLLVPLMIIVLRTPPHVAVGTSLLQLVGVAALGAIGHWILGNLDVLLVGLLTSGGVIGAPIGAIVTRKLPAKTLKIIFSTLLIALAVKMLV